MSKFTLNDPLFIDAMLAGIEGANDTAGLEVYLIGGGAIQHYAAGMPELRRPTIDIDLQSRTHVPRSLRNRWGHSVEQRLLERRRKGVYRNEKTVTGAEVKIETPDNSTFFVHLDLFRPKYIAAHESIIGASFERKRPLDVRGRLENHHYFVQAPEDISYHKLKRLINAVGTGRLSEDDERVVRCMASGLIDDVQVGDLRALQEELGELKNMNLEEVSRQGFETTTRLYNCYRDLKSLYDLRLLVAAHRDQAVFTDPKIIKQNIEQDESVVERAKDKRIFI